MLLAGLVDPAPVSICHYLEQHSRVGDRSSSFERIRFTQPPAIQFLKLSTEHAEEGIL